MHLPLNERQLSFFYCCHSVVVPWSAPLRRRDFETASGLRHHCVVWAISCTGRRGVGMLIAHAPRAGSSDYSLLPADLGLPDSRDRLTVLSSWQGALFLLAVLCMSIGDGV